MSSETPERAPTGARREGDYPDHDVPEGDVETDVGEYTDTDVRDAPRGEPDDGTYADTDVVEKHREAPVEGSYTDTDNPTPEETQHG